MREMKDSGIEWIGEIPKDWSITKYKRFTSNRMGETILAKDLTNKGIPVYSATQEDSFFGYLENPKLKLSKYSLIIPARGASIGYAKIVTEEIATCTQTTICSTNIHDAVPKFLYYCCHGLRSYWFRYDGSAIPQVTVEQIENNFVPIPPLSEQCRIADFLDSKCAEIDSLTADIEKQIETLDQYKKSIITEAVTKGLDPDAEMKDSGVEWIGYTPKTFQIIPLKYVCSMQSGDNITSQNIFEEGDYKVFGGNGLRGYFSNFNTFGESVLIGRQGALAGNTHYVDEKIWATDHAVVTKAYQNTTTKFLYYSIFAMDLNRYAYDTAAQPGLAVNKVLELKITLPNLDEQKEIANFLDQKCCKIESIISDKQSQLDALSEYKKSLIYEYVTGKKEVPIS